MIYWKRTLTLFIKWDKMNLSDEQRKIVRSNESGFFQINRVVESGKTLNDNLRILKIEDVCRI